MTPDEAQQLVMRMFNDLQLTLPEDLRWSVSDDAEMVYVTLRREGHPFSVGTCGSPVAQSRCHLAEKVLSDLQDYMADIYSVWWPMLGRHRLNYEIDCVDDRPRLIFTL
ncbi:hypothetical protein ACINK0_15020 [Deinococcus sp. VB343]|uniref:Uncharacterized protein n=1 Tax=Deinococcus sp. VB142 TaxID=3112952 RepID=A0AAU6Q6Z9_9DEIO